MTTLRNHLLLAAGGALLFAGIAFAQATAPATSGPARAAWQPARIVEHLQKQGYTNVHDVEWDDDGHWEVDAVNPAGRPVDLDIDPATGRIIREKLD
jgi:hypothetical protein